MAAVEAWRVKAPELADAGVELLVAGPQAGHAGAASARFGAVRISVITRPSCS